ncbi:MAG: aldo/keto reductase [Oligoflexia bacterium]|nr:aldo/keto reductase [Oligoflexia bacterium]
MKTPFIGATPAGTRAYFSRHPSQEPRRLGKTELSVSNVGFGGYRIHDRDPVHREALRQALRSGCNLVDTSANYGDGASELLIGQVLAELFETGELRREQVVVVTKAGFLQGENLVRDLEDQLDRSLHRLGLASLDILLLHNPEYFLAAGGDHAEFYRQIGAAFAYLETQVARGRIGQYGISSNSLVGSKTDPEFTSLAALLDLPINAEKAASGFRVIQFPFNLLEAGAALEDHHDGKTLLELAASADLGTLANRPLNARLGNRLLRLAEFAVHDPELTTQRICDGIARLTELEATFPPGGAAPEEFHWGHILQRNFNRLEELETWKNFLAFRIRPALAAGRSALPEPEEQAWLTAYLTQAERLFEAITHHLENHAAVDADRVSRTLLEVVPGLSDVKTLSRKVLRIYRSFPGLHCILIGMRRPEYVHDALEQATALSEDEAVRALAAMELLR